MMLYRPVQWLYRVWLSRATPLTYAYRTQMYRYRSAHVYRRGSAILRDITIVRDSTRYVALCPPYLSRN